MKRRSNAGFDDRFDDFDDKGRPVLITGAAPSYEEEHRARVRKYLTLMAFRIPALILAVGAAVAGVKPTPLRTCSPDASGAASVSNASSSG